MWLRTISWCVVMGLALGSGPAAGLTLLVDPDSLKPDYPRDGYKVAKGQTLWDVSGVFLRTPWSEASLEGQEVPELSPGDEVSIVEQGGRLFMQFKHKRNVRMTPYTRMPPQEQVKEVILLSSVRQFLNRPQILTQAEIEAAGYIIASPDGNMLMTEGNQVYARNLPTVRSGETYTVVRPGQVYRLSGEYDEESSVLEAVYLGEAVVRRDGDPVTLALTSAEREIRIGDILLPSEGRRFERDFEPHSPVDMNPAQIISVVDGVSQIGQHQIVVINQGEQDGIEVGHVLGVYKGGRRVEDTVRGDLYEDEELVLPSEKSGDLLVFRVFDNLSYALVTKAVSAIHLFDEVNLP